MNSQPSRPRHSASQGAIRTPKNYIQENIAKLRDYRKKHQATPMPATSKTRTNSQPAPKLSKVAAEPVQKTSTPRLVPVKEENTQSVEKHSAQKLAEVVFGETGHVSGTSYGEIAQKTAEFQEEQRRLSGPRASVNSLVSRSSQTNTPVQSYHPTAGLSPRPQAEARPISPMKPTPRETTTDTNMMEDKGFAVQEQRGSIPLSQTYAGSRKSLQASQSALNAGRETPMVGNVQIEEGKKSTPQWAVQTSSHQTKEQEGSPMQEVKLFEGQPTPMVIEENFPPKSPVQSHLTSASPQPRKTLLPPPSSSPSVPVIDSKLAGLPVSYSPKPQSKTPSPVSIVQPSMSAVEPQTVPSKSPTPISIVHPPMSVMESRTSKTPSPVPLVHPPMSVPQTIPSKSPTPVSALHPPMTVSEPIALEVPTVPSPISQFAANGTSSRGSITPKSILRKSVSPKTATSLPEVEGANTDASDSELPRPATDESLVDKILATPVQKRKRFNAALLTEFDVPVEALSECEAIYDAEALSLSAKRRKKGR